MKSAWARSLLSVLLPLGALGAPTDGTSPPEVITRLVVNASKSPLGPVENDVTDQAVETCKAMMKSPMFKDSMGSVRESIATEYNEYTLAGPLASLYSEGSAALFCGKVNLTPDTIADHKDDDGAPCFGDSGGFLFWVGPKPKDDGHAIATFCLVQQHGVWKVHGVYLSNEIIDGSNKDFIIKQLAAFANK